MSTAARTVLVVVRPEHREAYRAGREHLAALLGVSLPQGWPEFPEFFESDTLPDLGPTWPACFFIDPDQRCLVGNGGFTGPPDADGCVEIGYEVAPAFRGRGHATRAAQALVDLARSRPEARAVLAHTLAETNASNAVLRKLGLRFVAELPNDEVGRVWQWRLDL